MNSSRDLQAISIEAPRAVPPGAAAAVGVAAGRAAIDR